MRKPWIIFFLCVAAGLVFIALLHGKPEGLSDIPSSDPKLADVVPKGSSTHDIVRSEATPIESLMQPSPTIRKATNKLISLTCEQGTDLCRLQAIYDFVRHNIEFRERTPEHAYVQAPAETLYYGSGDEMELALLIASMQRSITFENQILEGPYHTFVRTTLGNRTIMIDPSCQGCKFMDVRVALRGDEKVYR